MRIYVLLMFYALVLGCVTTGPQATPDAPRDLTATSGLDSQVDIAWREPTSGEPDNYRVYRFEEGGSFTQIAEIDGNLNGYTDATAVNGTYYEYRLTAVSGGAESDPSDNAWATPYYDFELTWSNSEDYYLPTEGDGVFYCIERPVDVEQVEVFYFEGPYRKELAHRAGELFTINVDDSVVDVLDTEGNYLRSIGESGHEGAGMADPFGLDVSEDGTLYVVDQGEESLLTFNATTGELIWRISASELPADFLYPADAAVASDGFVYLVSGYSYPNEFLVIDTAGRQIKRVPFEYGDTEMYLAVADDFTVCLAEGERFGGSMVAYRPVGFSGNEEPPMVAFEGGVVR